MGQPSFRPQMRRSRLLPICCPPQQRRSWRLSLGACGVCAVAARWGGGKTPASGPLSSHSLVYVALSGSGWLAGSRPRGGMRGTMTVTHFTNGDALAHYRGRSCDSPSGHESSPEAGLCHRVLLGSPGTQQGRPWVVRQSRAREQGHEVCPYASAGWRAPWAPTAVPRAPVRKSWVGTVTATAFQSWEGRAGQLEASR